MAEITLTQKDIVRLSRSMSTKTKAEAIKKVGHYYSETHLTDNERKIAEDILRSMVEDVEIQVRATLVDSVKSSNVLPKDISKKLIDDIDTVSLPFIKKAASLNDEDLFEILKSQGINKQKAVASRKNISKDVSQYIAEECSEEIVESLLANENAEIIEKTYGVIANKYSGNNKIKEKLLNRKNLPVSIIERIANSLSEILQDKLLASDDISNNIVSGVVEKVRDRLTLKISQEYNTDEQIISLVEQLYKLKRLNPTLIVRAICMGDLRFFECALSCVTGRERSEIRQIVSNTKDEFVLRNIMRETNIPSNLFPAVLTALKIIFDLNFNFDKENRENFTQKVIERVLTFDSINEKMDISDIEYLISKIS